MDKNARLLLDEHVNAKEEMFRPEIDRGPLQKMLLNSLQPGTVVWDRQFVSLTPEGESWEILFKNGGTVTADIVIAADGASSKVRPYLTPIKPFYSGVTGVEGAVYHSETASPKVHQLLNGGKIFVMSDAKTLIIGSKGDGGLAFYTSYKTDENWGRESGINFSDKAEVTAWFNKEYAGWDPVWMELFENAEAQFVLRPIYCMPLDQTWEAQPNLTMLGDAAHLMPPFAGEGVNMAMLDALELSQCLMSDDFPTILSAISAYEKQMRIRAAEAARQSLDSTDLLHSPDAIPFFLELMGAIGQ
jgi:2-polyprenyl-6-methoxyphenol hydroxylase-like FAD-dependent oxidoreductase